MRPSIVRFSKTYFSNFVRLSLLLIATGVFVLGWPQSGLSQTSPLTIKKRPADQRPVPGARPPARPAPNKQAPKKARAKQGTGPRTNGDEPEMPAPENVVLATSDGVKLTVTYFGPPATDGGEAKAIPFILLHEWEGDRSQLLQYGAFLQQAGHAAIVPDLRGHGESTAVEGLKKEIDATKFRKNEIGSVQKDIERCKKYLVQRNNEGEVNIDMLTVVAVGGTSVLAVEWVLNDWFAFPPINANGIKQGQDVKSLILVSPRKKLKGISLAADWKHPLYTGAKGSALPLMIIWAAGDEEAAKDSESLMKLVEKSRPDPKEIEDEEKREKATTLYGVPLRSSRLTGAQIMGSPAVKGLWAYTNKFVDSKVGAHKDSLPWKSRKKEQ